MAVRRHDLRPKRKRFSLGMRVRHGGEYGEVLWVDRTGVTVKWDDTHQTHYAWHDAYVMLVPV